MKYYTKILIWENKRRVNILVDFRKLIIKYFDNTKLDWMEKELEENEIANATRVKINRILDEVHSIVIFAGLNPSIRYTPPPAIGGYIQDVNLIHNIFIIHRFDIPPDSLLDFIDRAIGIYENNSRSSFFRTINPLFWIGIIFDFIARLPFNLIGRIGFNSKKAEESLLGKIIKGILYLITVVASFLTILHLLGYLENFKLLIKNSIKL